MGYLRQRLGLEADDTSVDTSINTMSRDDAFSEVLEWDGLIRYDTRIKSWIRDIYGVDLDELEIE